MMEFAWSVIHCCDVLDDNKPTSIEIGPAFFWHMSPREIRGSAGLHGCAGGGKEEWQVGLRYVQSSVVCFDGACGQLQNLRVHNAVAVADDFRMSPSG